MKRTRHRWTASDDSLLRDEYGRTPTRDIARQIGVSENATSQRAHKLGLRFEAIWTTERDAELRRLYPDNSAAECAALMGVDTKAVEYRSKRLGLYKSRDWIRERARQAMERPDHPARQTRIQPGAVPWNKGSHYVAGGRSAETRFKTGNRPHTWNPIGHERETKDGYLQRKVRDTRVTRRDYAMVHHLVWRMHGHSIPPGHALCFIDGDKRNFDINNLELVPRADLMRRNSVHNHGPEVAKAYQLIGALRLQINKREKESRA